MSLCLSICRIKAIRSVLMTVWIRIGRWLRATVVWFLIVSIVRILILTWIWELSLLSTYEIIVTIETNYCEMKIFFQKRIELTELNECLVNHHAMVKDNKRRFVVVCLVLAASSEYLNSIQRRLLRHRVVNLQLDVNESNKNNFEF